MSRLLAHRVDGAGEPLLLLNGGMMTMASWEPIAVPLAERFRVVRCDFRGQFASPGTPPLDIDGHVSDVVSLLDAIGIESTHVIGTSFGGEVGLALAATHPRQVRSLVAATATEITDAFRHDAAALHRATAEAAAGGDAALLFDAMLPVFYSPVYIAAHRGELDKRRGQLGQLPAWWFASAGALLESLESFDLRPCLPRIACPTLVLAAAEDRIMPLEEARALAAAIRGARLEVIEGSGHVLVVEQPDRFVRECLAFLASVQHREAARAPS
jgi:pimeloyl-ACP methyl ester carboxylesterase